ncbi:MAG: hypothetical protein BJ554DRAFT_8279 [Olpidium bornovanus]|uniref:Uncharacterized protein n=1 Tax=Olpidium bornovanus TaxID=278681 RepID=A0A8H7ZUK8_9FUNG|nr:MAG: hypothetical protein BJ554DRAFT_8279 [Olpidium bornovanus]
MKAAENGIRNRTDAHLQRGTVRHEFGDLRSNPSFHIGRNVSMDNREGLVVLDYIIDCADMDLGAAEGPRHGRVDLRDNDFGGLRGRICTGHLRPQRAIAVTVRGRHGGNFGKEDGDVVTGALGHGRTGALADEEVAGVEAGPERRVVARVLLFQVEMAQLDVPEVRAPAQRLEHVGGDGGDAVDIDAIIVIDDGDSMVERRTPHRVALARQQRAARQSALAGKSARRGSTAAAQKAGRSARQQEHIVCTAGPRVQR